MESVDALQTASEPLTASTPGQVGDKAREVYVGVERIAELLVASSAHTL